MTLHDEFTEILSVLMEAPLATKKSPAPEKNSLTRQAGERSTDDESKSRKGAAS